MEAQINEISISSQGIIIKSYDKPENLKKIVKELSELAFCQGVPNSYIG